MEAGGRAMRGRRYALRPDDTTQQFLASTAGRTCRRSARGGAGHHAPKMLANSPDDTGLMNNLGYSLIEGHDERSAELDEGFKHAEAGDPHDAGRSPTCSIQSAGPITSMATSSAANRFIQMALNAYDPFAHWELVGPYGRCAVAAGRPGRAARKHWRGGADGPIRPPLNAAARWRPR